MKLTLLCQKKDVTKNKKKSRKITAIGAIVIIAFLVVSAIPSMANGTVTVYFQFKDQYGNDLDGPPGLGTGNERVYVNGHGYRGDNGFVTIPSGTNVQYRAYYKLGSGLYGPQIPSSTFNADGTINVVFRELDLKFSPSTSIFLHRRNPQIERCNMIGQTLLLVQAW